METYEDKEGNIWSKEIKDGRLVEKLIERNAWTGLQSVIIPTTAYYVCFLNQKN